MEFETFMCNLRFCNSWSVRLELECVVSKGDSTMRISIMSVAYWSVFWNLVVSSMLICEMAAWVRRFLMKSSAKCHLKSWIWNIAVFLVIVCFLLFFWEITAGRRSFFAEELTRNRRSFANMQSDIIEFILVLSSFYRPVGVQRFQSCLKQLEFSWINILLIYWCSAVRFSPYSVDMGLSTVMSLSVESYY